MLKILRSLCDFGKCLSFKRRNDFATSVCTFWLIGGLNQIIFLDVLIVPAGLKGPWGGGTPSYDLYGYVPLDRVWFWLFCPEQGI